MNVQSALYLLPVGISDARPEKVLPPENLEILNELRFFIVENVRTARRFIKRCNPAADISSMIFYELNRHTDEKEISTFLQPLREGLPMGVMSEAGCPGVADPGALPVRIAQSEGFRVIPLVGPSSILLALMASGLNGQNFSFHGYLPVENAERERKIKELESQSSRSSTTQIFIETPYRNEKMFGSLLKTLKEDTLLCVATAVTDPENERIVSKTITEWKRSNIQLEKLPTVFLFLSTEKQGSNHNYGKKKNFI